MTIIKEEMNKDDMPHAPATPEDAAHDVTEEGKKLAAEIAKLAPEQKQALLEHLRQLRDEAMQRSPENQAAGQLPAEQAAQQQTMNKSDIIKADLKKAWQPKFVQRNTPNKTRKEDWSKGKLGQSPDKGIKGVHARSFIGEPGSSAAGEQVRQKHSMMTTPKQKHQEKLQELKSMKKPLLPKSEITKEEKCGKAAPAPAPAPSAPSAGAPKPPSTGASKPPKAPKQPPMMMKEAKGEACKCKEGQCNCKKTEKACK